MTRSKNDVNRFALLLLADAKLVEVSEVLDRVGLAKDGAKIAALRSTIARAMQPLQDGVYECIQAI